MEGLAQVEMVVVPTSSNNEAKNISSGVIAGPDDVTREHGRPNSGLTRRMKGRCNSGGSDSDFKMLELGTGIEIMLVYVAAG